MKEVNLLTNILNSNNNESMFRKTIRNERNGIINLELFLKETGEFICTCKSSINDSELKEISNINTHVVHEIFNDYFLDILNSLFDGLFTEIIAVKVLRVKGKTVIYFDILSENKIIEDLTKHMMERSENSLITFSKNLKMFRFDFEDTNRTLKHLKVVVKEVGRFSDSSFRIEQSMMKIDIAHDYVYDVFDGTIHYTSCLKYNIKNEKEVYSLSASKKEKCFIRKLKSKLYYMFFG